MSHVFEHVLDPVIFLGHLLRATRPGGLVFIEVPNESISEVKRQVRAPFRGKLHLSYFSPLTLERCAKAAGGGTVKLSAYGPRASEFSLVPNEMLRPRVKLAFGKSTQPSPTCVVHVACAKVDWQHRRV